MRTSTNYRFNLPELSDVADVTKLTANWESLDSTLRTFAVGLADTEDTVHQISTRDLPAIRQSVTDVSQYAESVGASVSALDTEIHTTRPYMTVNTEQTITAKKHIPTATVNDSSDVWVNKAFVQATDGRNNLIHSIGFEQIFGIKKHWDVLEMGIDGDIRNNPEPGQYHDSYPISFTDLNGTVGGFIRCVQDSNGIMYLQCALKNSDGTYKFVDLARSD